MTILTAQVLLVKMEEDDEKGKGDRLLPCGRYESQTTPGDECHHQRDHQKNHHHMHQSQ